MSLWCHVRVEMSSSESHRMSRALRQHIDSLRAFGVTAVPATEPGHPRSGSAKEVQKIADFRPTKPGGGLSKEQRLAHLAKEVDACRRCPLYQTRTHAVISDGTPHAELVFVGEAPGRDEDLQGVPFVGRAGQLLTKMIEAMGLKRQQLYICNVLKDRPPGNRTPLPEEMEACLPFLMEQIAIVRPRVICVLGSVAAKALIGPDVSITKIRGRTFDLDGITVVPTFHPAYLLRNPPAKKFAWVDLKLVKQLLDAG